ncbi:uncharacterized protein tp53i13 [Heterodontus francisci]|uniref:uncharacterized protein tp53i13 n=1 Tax=Heterodontus francisci TaxID=7792 RepID=UPI00355C33A0
MVRNSCGCFMEPGAGLLLLLLLGSPRTEARTRWAPYDHDKLKLQTDLPPVQVFICPGPTWPLPKMVVPSVAKEYSEQEAARVCMGERIEYIKPISNSGMHRPIWAMYGEYLYIPPRRWVHNLQCGGIAFLYHPCVHPRLKEELSLLARMCMYKHIITPHLNLSQQRPLALVAWGKSLEMSRINLAEAVPWLRKSVNGARNSELKDDGAYNYLLILKAKLASDNNDRVACPGNRVKELQRYFKKGDLQSAIRKWSKVGEKMLSKGLHVILRRRRNSEPREPTQTNNQVAGTSFSSQVHWRKQNKDSANNTSIANPAVKAVPLFSGQPEVGRRQPTVPAVIARDSEKAMESRTLVSQETKKGNDKIGGEQNSKGNELASTLREEVTISTLSEAQQHAFLDSTAAKLPSSYQHHQIDNTSGSLLDLQEKAHWTNREDNLPKGQIKSGGSITGEANNQMVEYPAIKEQQIAKIIANTNQVPDSQSLNRDTGPKLKNRSKLSGKNVKPLQHNSEISSKNDIGNKQNEDTNKRYTGEMGSDRTVHKMDVEQPDSSKTNETVIQNAQDDHNNDTAAVGSGNAKCKCEDGASQNVQTRPDGAVSNNLKAGALKKTQHHVEDRTLYIPTPRTEEAAWAAAALAFLFVFLTLSVLYTRLYRKFIKSDSLYWAPVPGIDGKESVADVIKRRLTGIGKRRKKRPLYKKKSISSYDVLPSDNSD